MPIVENASHPVPVTILTGFLGSGKTTLLNRILSEGHGQKIVVIENEFGEVGVDRELLENSAEHIVEMNNGCVCCTVRGDMTRILGQLAARRDRGEAVFDRVIIETTGLADPAPVAQVFFAEKDINEYFSLDAVVTIVDAKHALQQLEQHHEAREQVGFADRLLLSKTDLATEQETQALMERLRHINARAPMHKVHFGEIGLDRILDIQSFNLDAMSDIASDFPSRAGHAHDDEIGSFVFRSPRPFHLEKLDGFLNGLLVVYGKDLLRYKGVLYVQESRCRMVFQGVHMSMGSQLGKRWTENEKPENVMVFIGRGLPKDLFLSGLEKCLVH